MVHFIADEGGLDSPIDIALCCFGARSTFRNRFRALRACVIVLQPIHRCIRNLRAGSAVPGLSMYCVAGIDLENGPGAIE